MERISQFNATVYRISTDKDGESKVVFEVPLSDMPSVARLLLCLEQVVLVTVDKNPSE